MRENRAKQKLVNGQIVTVTSGHQSSDMIDFLGPLGFDAMWLETEHGPVSWEQIGDMSRACDLWGMSPIVRVNANEPWLITRTLDRGASGIVVPHVSTKAEADKAMQSAKYAPLGYRGMFGGRRSFGVADYFKTANDETIVVVLIEEIEAVQNLAEILTVDHIDVFFVPHQTWRKPWGISAIPRIRRCRRSSTKPSVRSSKPDGPLAPWSMMKMSSAIWTWECVL